MDIEMEQHLLWIAQEGLLEEPPAEWKPCKSPDGDIYYFNFKTGESMWDHPCDESFRELYREQRELSLMAARQRLAWKACCAHRAMDDSILNKPEAKSRSSAYKPRSETRQARKAAARNPSKGGRGTAVAPPHLRHGKPAPAALPQRPQKVWAAGTTPRSSAAASETPDLRVALQPPRPHSLPLPGTMDDDDELRTIMKELGIPELMELLDAHDVDYGDCGDKDDFVECAATCAKCPPLRLLPLCLFFSPTICMRSR